MAERRMFTKKITESDAFLDMPCSTQVLYFHLNMSADDDGFVNNPKKIQRMVGCSDDDMKLLILKSFIIVFESGVIVIKHWKMHNYIQSDRYKPTDYTDEKSLLEIKRNKAYTLAGGDATEIPENTDDSNNVYKMDTDCVRSVSVGKDRLGKVRDKDIKDRGVKSKTFTPPSVEEVKSYLNSVGSKVDAEAFVAFYDSKDWMIGKNKMKNWKSAVVTWEKRNGLKRTAPKEDEKPNYETVAEEPEEELVGDDWWK